jgi:hypothetical protein
MKGKEKEKVAGVGRSGRGGGWMSCWKGMDRVERDSGASVQS